MLISVVIPAYEEEDYLGRTLDSLNRARAFLREREGVSTEIIVVDNDSTDSTAEIARKLSANVVRETVHNIAKVRNTGAGAARGDVLVFVDADTTVPAELLARIAASMSEPDCLGGAVDTDYRPLKLTSKIYLWGWRVVGKLLGLAQGATQFCRRDVFVALGGYDETLFMYEDVNFFQRMKRLARRRGGHVSFIDEVRVTPSTRRFNQWSFWRTLIWTNPLFIFLFRRRASAWHGWYKEVPR